MSLPVEYEATPYAVRLAKIMERNLRLVGVFIGVCILTAVFSGIGFFIIIQASARLDSTKNQMCAGFEDVAEKALSPFQPPANATAEQLNSYRNVNIQKDARLAALARELRAHSSCNVSIND